MIMPISPDEMKRRNEARSKLDADERKTLALEQISDALRSIQIDFIALQQHLLRK